MSTSPRSFRFVVPAAILRRVFVTSVLVACSASDPADPVSTPVDGTWSAATTEYSSIRIELGERPTDHALTGSWTGVRTSSTKIDSGIVFYGSRLGGQVSFGITALNATRALDIDGTLTAANRLTGTVRITDQGVHTGPSSITLSRQ